jgi:hypothetical protein
MLKGSAHEHTIATHYHYYKDVDQKQRIRKGYDAAKEQHTAYMQQRPKTPWEYKLYEIVDNYAQKPDHRIIYWFYDEVGEAGKTVNAKNLIFNYDAFYTTGGKCSALFSMSFSP